MTNNSLFSPVAVRKGERVCVQRRTFSPCVEQDKVSQHCLKAVKNPPEIRTEGQSETESGLLMWPLAWVKVRDRRRVNLWHGQIQKLD